MKKSTRYVKKKITFRKKIVQLFSLLFRPRFYIWIIKNILYALVDRALGASIASIGKGTKIHPTSVIREAQNVSIGCNCMINHGSILHGGKDSAKLILGDHVQLGPNVMMFCFNHDTRTSNEHMMTDSYLEADIKISDNVWIGAGSIITSGVKIGKGAVIGSGSIITKDVEENAIVVGPRASRIKFRD
ncbi:MAG: acyltransferase [Flavobacteriaceae bacterium]|nr:acyltransferase [Flavobacteriaceae bacterium]